MTIKKLTEKLEELTNSIEALDVSIQDIDQDLTALTERVRDLEEREPVDESEADPLPCPICGEAGILEWNELRACQGQCSTMMCDFRGPVADTEEDAIEKWNEICEKLGE